MAIEWLPDNNKFTWVAYGNANDTQLSNSANDKEFVYIAFNKDKKEQSFKIDDYDLKLNNSYSKLPYVYPALLNKLPSFYAPLTFDLKGQINSICPTNELSVLIDQKHKFDINQKHSLNFAGLQLCCPKKSIEASQSKDSFKPLKGSITTVKTIPLTDETTFFGTPVTNVKNSYRVSYTSDNISGANSDAIGVEFEIPELQLKAGDSFTVLYYYTSSVQSSSTNDDDHEYKLKFEEYGVSDTEIIFDKHDRKNDSNECNTKMNVIKADNCIIEECGYHNRLDIPKLYRAIKDGTPKFRFTFLNKDGTNISNRENRARLNISLHSVSKETCRVNIDSVYPEYLVLKLANRFKTNDFAYKVSVASNVLFDDQKSLILCGTEEGDAGIINLYDKEPFKFESTENRFLYTVITTPDDKQEIEGIGGYEQLGLEPNKFAFMLYRRGKDLVFRYVEQSHDDIEHRYRTIYTYDRKEYSDSDIKHYEAVAKDVDNHMHEITLYYDSKTGLHHIYIDGELKGSSTRPNKFNNIVYNMPLALIFGSISDGKDFHHAFTKIKDVTVYVDNCPFLIR